MKVNTHLWAKVAYLLLEWEIFETKFVEENKTHFYQSLLLAD